MRFLNDFMRGQRDCRKGVPHKPDQSNAYNRGYATQYELEQLQTEMTKNARNHP